MVETGEGQMSLILEHSLELIDLQFPLALAAKTKNHKLVIELLSKLNKALETWLDFVVIEKPEIERVCSSLPPFVRNGTEYLSATLPLGLWYGQAIADIQSDLELMHVHIECNGSFSKLLDAAAENEELAVYITGLLAEHANIVEHGVRDRVIRECNLLTTKWEVKKLSWICEQLYGKYSESYRKQFGRERDGGKLPYIIKGSNSPISLKRGEYLIDVSKLRTN